MPQGRFRSISLNVYIEQFPRSLNLGENDFLKTRVEELEEYLDFAKFDGFPKVEYGGKVPLNRNCGHGKPMEQLKIHTTDISVQCMSELIDMGWRREGNNFYKIWSECCRTHALRLNGQNFKLSKNQKKILNHLNDFCQYGYGQEKVDGSCKAVAKPVKNGKMNKPNEIISIDTYFRRIAENCDAHKVEIRLVRPGSEVFNQTYEESFQLYQKYQENMHNNIYTKEHFENNLVDTPLTSGENKKYAELFGTFHRQYLIDGKLVAVELIDVLPNYVMAQSTYYDMELTHLNLGTLMLLNGILLSQKLSETTGKQVYFSTGLYNHCNKKHHYKLQLADEILCIDTKTWVPLTKDLIPLLENGDKITSDDTQPITIGKIFSTPCCYNGKILKYGTLQEIMSKKDCEKSHKKLLEYVKEVGVVAEKMIFSF